MTRVLDGCFQWIDARLTTPVSRTLVAFTVLGLLSAAIWWQREPFGLMVLLGFGFVLLRFSLMRISAAWLSLRTVFLRRLVRLVRTAARVNAMSSEVEILQLMLVIGAILVMASALVMNDPRIVGRLGTGMACVAIAVSLIDIPQRLAALLRLAWARTMGKVLLGALGALAIVGANVLAKHTIHHFVQVDPKFMPDSQALAVLLIVPAIYVCLSAYLLVAWSLLNLLFSFVLWSFFVPLGSILDSLWRSGHHAATWYRISRGNKPPPGYKPPGFPWSAAKLALRHLSVIVAVLFAQSEMGAFIKTNDAAIDRVVVGTIVALDFKSDSTCADLPAGARVAYLDRDQVAVAMPTDLSPFWSFGRRPCAGAASAP